MADTSPNTDRRSFLKAGALVAAPVAAVGIPAAALADDGTRAKLARLEDERAIDALHRGVLRRINGNGADRCAEFLARPDAIELEPGLCAIAEDPAADVALELAADGCSATARTACRVEIETHFTGNSTVEQMTRFQGQASHRRSEARVLASDYVKTNEGWRIAKLRLT